MPIVSDGHADLCSSIQEMLVESLAAKLYESPSQLASASQLVIAGLGQWGGDEVREALRVAGQLGVQRTLWQLETLPPMNGDNSVAARILLRRTPDRVTGLARLIDKYALRMLDRELQQQEWWRESGLEARRLGLPYREARRIRELWREKLLDRVLVSLESRLKFLHAIGVDASFIPLGYHPLWGHPLAHEERKLDAIFIGTPTSARIPQITRVREQLSAAGFNLTVIEGGCYGEQRTRLLNNAKILIHLRNYPWEMTRMRMLMGMGCKSLVVTEDFWDVAPFVPGTHLVTAPPEGLGDAIIHYLRNETEREDIVEQAYSLIANDLELGRLLTDAIESSDRLRS